MSLKNLFKNNDIDKENIQVPQVICDDIKLKVAIGQWLGILDNLKYVKSGSLSFHASLSTEELMKKNHISEKTLDEISRKFGNVLRLAKVNSDETCTLSNYSNNNGDISFNCHYKNTYDDAKITLEKNLMTKQALITIDYKDTRRCYEYFERQLDIPAKLKSLYFEKKNDENNNSYYRRLWPCTADFELTNGEYSFAIDISCPEKIQNFASSVGDGYIFYIRNEDELEKYLLGLKFPFQIDEVYKKICEICIDLKEYPKFELRVEKNNVKSDITTDLISFRNGEIETITVTRGEATINVDRTGNWSYQSANLSVMQNNKGNINYNIRTSSSEELSFIPTPKEQFDSVNKEVEQVKMLKKTLLNQDN